MDARSVIATKRDGGELSAEQSRWFLDGYSAGRIPDYQAAALAMAIFVRGMGAAELERWTDAMLHSGAVLRFDEIAAPKVDKHSTGGVGDKVSIPLAPALAACGAAVPMISGRGLGHTGGTLDKLESIPGLRTDLSERELHETVGAVGLAFGAQTQDLVPADRKLYALRDVTALVESVPLIASSILSKKLAEGLDALVLDVKFGSGAFLPEPERGRELARTMLALAEGMGVRAAVYLTDMGQPLGRAVGHALEIAESIECLRGGGPADLRELVELQGGELLALAGLAAGLADGRARIARALEDGSALERFARVVAAQGGDAAAVEDPARLPRAPALDHLRAERDGLLDFVDLRAVGLAACELGGGRVRLGDAIDPAVGFVWRAKRGQRVRAGEPLCEIHHADGRGLDAARELLARAVRVADAVEETPLVLERLEGAAHPSR